jgi:hypothetical protein
VLVHQRFQAGEFDMSAYASMAFAGLIATAAISGVRAQAPDRPVTYTYYGLTFPLEIGSGRRISFRDYEKTSPGLGYSVGYQHQSGATSTVYIYDGGLRQIPDDVQARVVTQQLEQAQSDIRSTRPAGTVEDKARFAIVDSGRRPRLLCESVVIRNGILGDNPGASPIDSVVCVGVVNGKFFKVRTSMAQRPDSDAEVRSFAQAWAEHLWHYSGSR